MRSFCSLGAKLWVEVALLVHPDSAATAVRNLLLHCELLHHVEVTDSWRMSVIENEVVAAVDTMNLVFVRHAESRNNEIAEEVAQSVGMSPYAPGTRGLEEYEKRRQADPGLSQLGAAQVDALGNHPHLLRINLAALVKQGRVRLFSSPLKRALLTAAGVQKCFGSPSTLPVTVLPDLCEHGGHYSGSGRTAKSTPGLTRSELEKEWAARGAFDFSACGESGWWQTKSRGFEDSNEYDVRIERVYNWIRQISSEHVKHNRQKSSVQPPPPDYTVVITHGDFLSTVLRRLLMLTPFHFHN